MSEWPRQGNCFSQCAVTSLKGSIHTKSFQVVSCFPKGGYYQGDLLVLPDSLIYCVFFPRSLKLPRANFAARCWHICSVCIRKLRFYAAAQHKTTTACVWAFTILAGCFSAAERLQKFISKVKFHLKFQKFDLYDWALRVEKRQWRFLREGIMLFFLLAFMP